MSDTSKEIMLYNAQAMAKDLINYINYDHNKRDIIQMGSVRSIFDMFIPYSEKREWLKGFIQDIVDVYVEYQKENMSGDMTGEDTRELNIMAFRLGVDTLKMYTVTYTCTYEILALSAQVAEDRGVEAHTIHEHGEWTTEEK